MARRAAWFMFPPDKLRFNSARTFSSQCTCFSGEPLIRDRGMVTDDKLLAATVTSERSHFLETHFFLLATTLLYCHCPHFLNVSD
jgi:hypothetical protein